MKHLVLSLAALCAPVVALADASAVRPQARAVAAVSQTAPAVPVTVSAPAPATTAPAAQSSPDLPTFATDLRPPARNEVVPRTRWQHMEGHVIWTRAALSALKDHGKPLVDVVPRDIANWCPAYPDNTDADRRAFWVGFMSALAKHESTYKPWAVGGGGQWYGLLQILPQTARWRKCNVGTGEALKNGAANLSCAARIMAITVPRDGVIHGYRGKRGLGVTADWGPMHKAAKRRDMANWLKRQTYCTPKNTQRPRVRPAGLVILDDNEATDATTVIDAG